MKWLTKEQDEEKIKDKNKISLVDLKKKKGGGIWNDCIEKSLKSSKSKNTGKGVVKKRKDLNKKRDKRKLLRLKKRRG